MWEVALEVARGRIGALEQAQQAHVVATGATRTAEEAAEVYANRQALVERLREIIAEVAHATVSPLIENANKMLDGRLELGFEADRGLVAVYGDWTCPVQDLSTGERLLVGVTLQATIAEHLGVGLAIVDDASGWDVDTARMAYRMMADHEDVTWLVASAQPLPKGVAAQVVEIEGGYSQ